MAEDLQGLLNRINEEGIKKTQAEKEHVLSDARDEAKRLVDQAKAEAKSIRENAEQEAAKLVQAGEDKLRQAARDVIVSLESELKELLADVVKANVSKAADNDVLGAIILDMAKVYAGKKGAVSSVDVLIPDERKDELDAYFKAKLGGQFKDGVTITPVKGLSAGVQVSFDGESVYHDFTDDAVAELLSAYLSPRLISIVRPEDSEG